MSNVELYPVDSGKVMVLWLRTNLRSVENVGIKAVDDKENVGSMDEKLRMHKKGLKSAYATF